MNEILRERIAERRALLQRITAALQADTSYRAAWLTGSFGRGEEDAFSDLDVSVVVEDSRASALCAHPWQVGGGTTPERLTLFSQFGQPAVIHENHYNAPPGGTFTFVLYGDSALVVDWTLIPQEDARRPTDSLTLFDTVGIPEGHVGPAESQEDRERKLTERTAFFWMLTSAAAKYLLRGDAVYFHVLLNQLSCVLHDVRFLTDGRTLQYRRGSDQRLCTTQEEQREALLRLCSDMSRLAPQGDASASIRRLLALSEAPKS